MLPSAQQLVRENQDIRRSAGDPSIHANPGAIGKALRSGAVMNYAPDAVAGLAPVPQGAIAKRLDAYFEIYKKGSTIRTELFAGLSTFLALSYIFIVNPAILSKAGIDPSVSLFATLVVSAGATLVMGLWARLPFVV